MNGGKLPTIRDVAARAGVSVMTVSRVANKQSWVSPATRAKVEKAIAELNYAPNATARALAGGDRRVALLYRSSTTSAYLGELLLGGMDEAARRHFHLVVEQCESGVPVEEVMARIVQARLSGVVMPPPLCDWDELIEALARQGVPAVMMAPDRVHTGLPVVAIDDGQAASDMTRHLIELGHRRIAFIRGNPRHRSSDRRLEGYRRTMAAQGLEVSEDYIVEGDFSYRSGLEAAERLLDLAVLPTAIFACNDDMAAAAITIAHQRQISVPAELSVCGFDDTPLAGAIWPALTTVRQPIRDMSRAAMTLLAGAIRGPGGESEGQALARLDYQIIRRQSDAVPPLHQERG
ncbi:LacI family DNA-binding transcriptional regulator [Sphingobium sp. Sx8-8]|uniref:LacI family DNA-binding transcriptional regulator n=1 Tax=Sphingobium sp. Sx8-8 TaxID=2933617 RepID=UPI001F5A1A7B|nr:LacI family DNA-binding transcriptional regulator [Sphingobium sp. Sx8-8]